MSMAISILHSSHRYAFVLIGKQLGGPDSVLAEPLEQAVAQAQEKEKLQRQITQLKAKMKKEKNLGKQMELRREINRLAERMK